MEDTNQNNHFILGTAGHVDHGKTALIKAITGIDCDTHPEEKLRGITINLGFSHLDFPNGTTIGIIDVPGHKDFINTMVSGASGMNLLMLIVAADSGIMPQTVEHIRIAEMLGIRSGIVVMTKIDLADDEMLMMAEEDINEFIKDTFLKDSPIFKVSSKTGEGIEELKIFLSRIDNFNTRKKYDMLFRMYIDRIFSVAGFGTVVTGSVLGGNIQTGANMLLLPGGKELKVRRLEKHNKEVKEISAGERAAINITGLKKEEFFRGMVISNREIITTKMLDTSIRIINPDKKINLWSHVIFLLGTFESPAKIHLIDAENVKCNEAAMAQIHLENDLVAVKGDKFILRNSSGDTTLGGGIILDTYPLHHKRRSERVINQLNIISKGGINETITVEVRKHNCPVTLECIASRLNISNTELAEFNEEFLPDDISYFKSNDSVFFIQTEKLLHLKSKIIRSLENFHKRNPLDQNGKTFDELMGIFGVYRNPASEGIMNCLLEQMLSNNELKRSNNTFTMSSHEIRLTNQDRREINFVEMFHKNCGLNTPLMSELILNAYKFGIPENKMQQILSLLTKQKKLYRIDNNYIHHSVVDKSRKILIKYLSDHPEGITVSKFRDLINANRKISLLLLVQSDRENLTYRDDDLRFLTDEVNNNFEIKFQRAE
jgi:selenocysteine-specific elongation factor